VKLRVPLNIFLEKKHRVKLKVKFTL
jgi:hypothetical protein